MLTAALLATATPLAGQQVLEQFSYDQLRFTGISGELGAQGSNKLAGTLTGAVRVDYGFFAPNIRLVFGVGYSRANFTRREINRFEQRLQSLVSGSGTITVGDITWTDVVLDADLQYVFPQGGGFTAYLGAGLSAHFRNGSGAAINGTFVEDALDLVGAGANATVGGEVPLAPQLKAVIEGRGVLSSDVNTASLSVGLKYYARPGPPR